MPLRIETRLSLLDGLLAPHASELGDDLSGYRNHAYRVVHFARAFVAEIAPGTADDPATLDKLAIAAAFHDLGIWTDGTFDYLAPSEQQAKRYLEESARGAWATEIGEMIAQHHKITRFEGRDAVLVEAFRRADWADVTRGVFAFGLPSTYAREVFAAFPNAGFHACLARLSWKRMRSHPFDPAPMMRL